MTTAFYSHDECRMHDMGDGHPECSARLDAIQDHLIATGLDAALTMVEAPLVNWDDVSRAHSPAYVRSMGALLEALARDERHSTIDPDTSACPATWRAVQRAAGAAVAATDAVMLGRARNAFCAVRPPGHHATRDAAMGFCFFNNVAIAARHALDVHGLQRVAIVDFDVHHGNGTEDMVAGDDRIVMVGVFQHPLYPYSGTEPKGNNIHNTPIPAYARGDAVRRAVQDDWLPRLEAFAPQMIFVSAGFDAHREDELGQLGLIEADYAWITKRIVEVADRHAQGRIVSCLEGGYALGALARSVAAHLRVLAALD
jgi:acetoin utilization deacetylase AcuC-like enzyme